MDQKVIYKELSYKIVGILFEVFDDLGYGYSEKFYQRAIEKCFKLNTIKYQREIQYKLIFKGESIGKFYFDFLVENKIILEIKRGNYFGRKNIEQVLNYLKVSGLELGILANFTSSGVKFMRVLNSKGHKAELEEYKIGLSKKIFHL